MESSALTGIAVAVVMIFLMFLPNLLFKPPSNYEEIREEFIKDMAKRSRPKRKKNSANDTQDYS